MLTLLLPMMLATGPEPAVAASVDTNQPAATEAPPAEPPTHKPEKRWQGLVRVGGLTDSGPLPDVGLAGLLAIGVNGPWVSLQGFGRVWIPRKARFVDIEEPGVSAWAWAAGPRGCFRHEVAPTIELPACLGVSFGQLRAQPFGVGVEDRLRTNHLWIEGDITVGVTLTPKKVPWLAIAGAFESGFMFKSPTLFVGDVAYHKPSHTSLRAFIALEFRFPTGARKGR